MRKRVWLYTLLLLSPGLKAQEVSLEAFPPEDAVRALLERSHLLSDTYFEVPTAVIEQFLRENRRFDQTPIPVIGEDARYELILTDGAPASLQVFMRIRVLEVLDYPEIPVLSAAYAWKDITLNGKPAAAALKGEWLTIAPLSVGVHELSAKVTLLPSMLEGNRLAMKIPRTSRTQVRFEASKGLTLQVGAGEATPSTQIPGLADKPTRGEVAIPPADRLELNWAPPMVQLERPPRFEVSGVTAWNLDETTQQVTLDLDVAIVDSRAEVLEFDLPHAVEKINVTGADVREAQVRGQHVTVYLRGKIEENTRLRMEWESALPASGLKSFQGVRLQSGHWSSGTLVISNSAGNAEVLAEGMSGLEPMALADVPPQARALLQGTPVLAYSVASRQFSAQVDVVSLAEFALRESIADLAHFELSYLEDGSMMGRVRYEIRNRNKQFLKLELPAGARVLVSKVNEKAVALAPMVESPDTYRLPLVRSTSSVKGLVSFPVEIVYVTKTSALERRGEVSLQLPRIDLPVAYAWCNAYLPEKMKVSDWRGTLKQVERFSSETATESLGYGVGMATEGYAAMAKPGKTQGVPTGGARDVAASPPATKAPAPAAPAPVTTGRTLSGEFLNAASKPINVQSTSAAIEISEEKPVVEQGSTTTGIVWKSEDDEVKYPHRVSFGKKKAEPKPATPKPAPAPPPPPPPVEESAADEAPSSAAQASLAKNYWHAGKDAYERGDLAGAAKSLENAVALGQGNADPEIANASRLLDNIQLAQGSLNLTSRAEKAAGAQVQRELNAGNAALERRQQESLERGMEAWNAGREDEARVQLQAAEELSKQLVAQGADKREQDARLRGGRETLEQIRATDATKAEELKKEVQVLKEEGRYGDALKSAQKLRKISSAKGGEGEKQADDAVENEIQELTVAVIKSRGEQEAQAAEKSRRKTSTRSRPNLAIEMPSTLEEEAEAYEVDGKTRIDGPARAPEAAEPPPPPVTRTYDVGGLVGDTGGDSNEATRTLLDQIASLDSDLASNRDKADAPLRLEGGRLVVTESAEVQEQVQELLQALEAAQGPRVELGTRIAQQQAAGLVALDDETGRDKVDGIGTESLQFRDFVARNYDWQATARPGEESRTLDQSLQILRERANLNLGQKVDISSVNLAVNASLARGIGVRFSRAGGAIDYAVLDEAQARTLLEIIAARGKRTGAMRLQETLVGSEALISNQQIVQVRFAGEKDNRIDLNGTSINLPHDATLLLVQNDSMTLVRVGAMQHWSRRPIPVSWITAPQTIELPRTGRRVSFEKTLLEPGDSTALHATYAWKGGSR